ncbi:MAG: TlpA family protein disulfide reductase [Ignavibacteria bacterium]|nr:TlpA family protein disulfide reductase [Ignavibacteria bacterium]
MKKLFVLFLMTAVVFLSCSKEEKVIKTGNWRAVLIIGKNDVKEEIPFTFSFLRSQDGTEQMEIINAEERIKINEISYSGDSVFIKMPVYKDEIKAKMYGSDSVAGEYYHYGSRSNYGIPFYAVWGKAERFEGKNLIPSYDITGRWETIMQPGDSNEYKMVGEFVQEGNKLTGTFLSAAGDYRYLEGVVSGNEFLLSAADGSHTVLFKAEIKDSNVIDNGILIGGPTWQEKWKALKNKDAELPDPEKLSQVKENTKIEFTFSDLNNNKVSLADEKFKGKVVILQIMGSWCPNCMDETKLLAELYETYQPKGLEIIGLSFESKDFEESKRRIERFVKQLNAGYTFLYAGEANRKNLFEALPFMKEFKGYPTTIYLDRNHIVKKVHTGFSGPGTGFHFEKLKTEIIQFIENLLRG